jgi:V8-like Glu-specific endopeptidase
MEHEDQERFIRILSRLALYGGNNFFRNLVLAADIPVQFQMTAIGALSGAADADALNLIKYTENLKTNPKNPKFTTLATILNELFNKAGVEDQRYFAALITKYGWYKDPQAADALRMRYQIPYVPQPGTVSDGSYFLVPMDASQDIVLQNWVRTQTGLLDVGFLQRGLKRVASVCRVEVLDGKRFGSGVLIASRLVLTNHHVLVEKSGEDLQVNARGTLFRFGDVTAANGKEAEGKTFKTAGENPVLAFSPAEKLDYVLIQVEEAIEGQTDIGVAETTLDVPKDGDGIHILQHPEGKAMKLALSADGVTKADQSVGIFQYVTATAGGSSGSPCFNDDWRLIGIHHAERATMFGAIREGILYKSIAKEIAGILPK